VALSTFSKGNVGEALVGTVYFRRYVTADAGTMVNLRRAQLVSVFVRRILRIPLCKMTRGAFLELLCVRYLLDRVVTPDAGDARR